MNSLERDLSLVLGGNLARNREEGTEQMTADLDAERSNEACSWPGSVQWPLGPGILL